MPQADHDRAARRERIALEYVRALLTGPSAYLWDKPDKLAEKAVEHADALIARLDSEVPPCSK